MTKQQMWTYDGAVLATGVNSREEFVRLAEDEGGYSVLGALGLSAQSAREEIGFAIGEPNAYRVPVPHFRLEDWDGAFMYRCPLDADPGRGFVKVVIFDPAAPKRPVRHEEWCHMVTGCTEPNHCTCEHDRTPVRPVCPQPCEHLSQEDAREGRTCAEHPCICTDRPDGSAER